MTKAAHLLPDAERRSIIYSLFVERGQVQRAIQTMDEMRQGQREGMPTACMLLVGAPGVGKTTFLKRYAATHPARTILDEAGSRVIRPVVYAELGSRTTTAAAAAKLLSALIGPNVPRGKDTTERMLEHQLATQRTELIIIDEFQHVAETGATITRSNTADWVKSLTKTTNVPIVMAGMDTIVPIVNDNKQLSSITPHRHELPDYDVDDPDEIEGFRDFLKELDAGLPFKVVSQLDDPLRSNRLALASGGNLRSLSQLLGHAARLAIDRKAKFISDDDFREACDEVEMHPTCLDNPFA